MPQENQCYITGNLARDPEMKQTKNGKAYCRFTLAASFKNGDKEYTEWVPVQVWGSLAESCGANLEKGKRVTVRGRFVTSSWTDNAGSKKYYTQIVAEQVALVLSSNAFASSGNGQHQGRGSFSQFGPATPEWNAGGSDAGTTKGGYQQEEIPF